jgi:hypothetical protein
MLPAVARALFAEDVGSLDFLIATTGHGVTRFAQAVDQFLVTSDVPGLEGKSSCYVATRKVSDGSLVWRRNVCSIASDNQSHAVAVSGNFVVTVDDIGVIRSWGLSDGNLVWEVQGSKISDPQVWETQKDGQGFIAVSSGLVLSPATGAEVDGVRAGGPSRSIEKSTAECPNLQVSFQPDRLLLRGDFSFKGEEFIPDGDSIENIATLSCTENSMNVLLSTTSGTTTSLVFTVEGEQVTTTIAWTAEEGLSSVSSALFLDATHIGVDDLAEEPGILEQKLSFSNRLQSQMDGILSLFESTGSRESVDDHTFGFVKVISLLSQKAHRVWGMDTSGSSRGDIRWTLDLPKNADWHRLVHGTTNSPKAVHGINGGTHSREILVLSTTSSAMEWICLDGTNGVVNAQGSVPLSSKVVQVVPIFGASESCRQAAMLLLEDESLVLVPADDEAKKVVAEHLASSANGVFAHSIDEQEGSLASFRLETKSDGSFATTRVGQTSFAGESILRVSYPMRDEVIHSMSTILGDNSLLLKYLNPHMALVVTAVKKEKTDRGNLSSAVAKEEGKTKKRKPAGAGDAVVVDESNNDKEIPNMFVNLVDTISGRILHRVSHVSVDVTKPISATLSENWVVYSFTNQKTRRTELGVLTLHEGMIDSKGLTFFSSPEQTTTFSSFDTRESKPVVLSKLYTYPKAITALGTTSTRAGISNKRIVIASADGKLSMVDRKMLETRRPTGDVRDAEKAEGLFQ